MTSEPRLPLTQFGPGTHVGHYTIIQRTGRGAMAEVFRALDTRAGREVALKVLDGAGERDRREAEAVRTLHHRNIVATLDLFEHEDRLCLVQEWIGGGSLDLRLRDGRTLDLEETVHVGEDVAAALAHAHRVTILHRDVKPSNVLRDEHGVYKLADFGAVGRLEEDTGMTRAGEIAGTPLYMAPEQFTGARQTPSTDLYGLGLLLYRCLHGEVPGQEAANFIDLYRTRTAQPIVVPPSPLRPLLVRCLDADPTRRPVSADEVLGLLQAVDLTGSAPQDVHVPRADVEVFDDRPADGPRVGPVATGVILLVAATLGWAWSGAGEVGRAAIAGGVVALAFAGGGIALASFIRRRWASAAPDVERRAAEIVLGAKERDVLTQSLVVEVERIISRLRSLESEFLGQTIAAFLNGYLDSPDSPDRQAALIHVVQVMEKVQLRLSPWHVRHKDAIASAVAILGCLAGLASAVGAFV